MIFMASLNRTAVLPRSTQTVRPTAAKIWLGSRSGDTAWLLKNSRMPSLCALS